ncbi:hypothetical protein KUTeg_021175 [Tegillarca granosa]|uniref:Disease resistance R13L4/SHOC-2-like LRR domain-containing protein n=1 Tax=Tegillarca granosa TaxID=220873 RepID=A0ABQ9EG05_TEGGR|nr:hypothetical protein KUTeg_021175 [Tegillarca granosa]
MGNYETHDLAPVRDDERKELNLSRRITFKQFSKHINGEFHEACLTEIPWSIRDSISLYERMNASFNAISEIPPELPLRLPHLYFLDLSFNQIVGLPESFGLLFHLRTLLLRHNKLKALPNSFVHLIKLEKVDLSSNMLKELPEDIGKMEKLTKFNVSGNKLKTLPLSLGNCKTLTVLLALKNRLQDPSQSICDNGSEATINFLQKRFKNSVPSTKRNRSVPNPHSAHVQYIQTQTHTTNTPSRIKTPLLPPLGSSQLDADVLRDRVVVMMTVISTIQKTTLHIQRFYKMDTVLVHWCERGFPELGDSEGIILSETIYKVTSDKSFLEHPQTTAKKLLSQNLHLNGDKMNGNAVHDDERSSISSVSSLSSENGNTSMTSSVTSIYKTYTRSDSMTSISGCDTVGVDNGAIVRTAILGVPSFHDITEVTENVIRICSSTHADGKCLASSVLISVVVALLLQVKNERKRQNDIHNETTRCCTYWIAVQTGFQLILKAGDSNSNACVAGAILGCKIGFSQLPKDWVSGLRKKQTTWLNIRINHLLDMLGLP